MLRGGERRGQPLPLGATFFFIDFFRKYRYYASMMTVDIDKRYVRVTNRERPGFVEFDFAIGDPELALEMILPTAAFTEFCAANSVVLLADE